MELLLSAMLLGSFLSMNASENAPALMAIERLLEKQYGAPLESFGVSHHERWLAYALAPPSGHGIDFGEHRILFVVAYPSLLKQVELGASHTWRWSLESDTLWYAKSRDNRVNTFEPSTGRRRSVKRPAGWLEDLLPLDQSAALILIDDSEGGSAICRVVGTEGGKQECKPLGGEYHRLYSLGPDFLSAFEVRLKSQGAARLEIFREEDLASMCLRRLPPDQIVLGIFPGDHQAEGLVLAQMISTGELVLHQVSCEGEVETLTVVKGACSTDKVDLAAGLNVESSRVQEGGIEVLFKPRAQDRPRPRNYFVHYDGKITCGGS